MKITNKKNTIDIYSYKTLQKKGFYPLYKRKMRTCGKE